MWALIYVLGGRVHYCVPSWNVDEALEPGVQGIVTSQAEYFIEPLGVVRMFVEFHAVPDHDLGDPHD